MLRIKKYIMDIVNQKQIKKLEQLLSGGGNSYPVRTSIGSIAGHPSDTIHNPGEFSKP